MPAAVVYIVRHGETDENRAGVMQGQLDTQLNAAGADQAARTADALEKVPFVRAHSSDLSRAIKTAETILTKNTSANVVLERHAALRERYMGDMQGQAIAQWGGVLPANMEATATFVGRADKWWKENIVRYVSSGHTASGGDGGSEGGEGGAGLQSEPAHILVVSHGGLIRVLVQNLLGSRKVVCGTGVEVDGRLRCANASITVIEVEKSGKGTLVLFADTTHLEVDLVEGNVDIVDDDDKDEKHDGQGSNDSDGDQQHNK